MICRSISTTPHHGDENHEEGNEICKEFGSSVDIVIMINFTIFVVDNGSGVQQVETRDDQEKCEHDESIFDGTDVKENGKQDSDCNKESERNEFCAELLELFTTLCPRFFLLFIAGACLESHKKLVH